MKDLADMGDRAGNAVVVLVQRLPVFHKRNSLD